MLKKVLLRNIAAIALACSMVPAAMAAKKVVLLQPVQSIDIRNAPWAVAMEKGWLAEGGIDLDIQFTKGASVLVQQVLSGNAQYGMPPPEPGVLALAKGGQLKYFFASTIKSPFPLAILENSKVKDLKDLKGTTIGLHSMTAVQFYTTRSILKSVGLSYPEDYKFVEVGAGPAALKALQDGQVSALAINIFTYASFESRGAKFRYMTTPEADVIPAWGLMTTQAYLQANRQEAINLGRAFARGSMFCRDNKDECVRIFLKRFPTVRTPGLTDEQTFSDQKRNLEKFNEYSFKISGKPWGWNDIGAWKAVVNYMVTSEQLPQAIDPSPLYTNELLPEINKF